MSHIPPKPLNAKFNDEQWEAIYDRGHNILVAASAGSGKTTVLIERILNHLLTNYAEIDQLLVSTFTEAAAKEMKMRMEARIKQAIQQTSERQLQLHLLTQLRKLPQAHIQTLHAFCLHLIQTYFYLIDCDPSVQLLTDETQKEFIYQEVWQTLLTDILTGEGAVYEIDLTSLKGLMSQLTDSRNDVALYQLTKQLYLQSCAQTEPEQWLQTMHLQAQEISNFHKSDLYQASLKPEWMQELLLADRLLLQATNLQASVASDTWDKYQELLNAEQMLVQQVINGLMQDDMPTIFNLMHTLHFRTWPANSKKSEDFDLVNEMKTYRDQAKKILSQLKLYFIADFDTVQWIEQHASLTLKDLAHLTLAFRQGLQRKKTALNVIDYNDLEHLALDILAPYDTLSGQRVASSAAHYYQTHFQEILVDEYQDINEIQAAILSWLSHDKLADAAGNSFMVGDVKQSIYGFRMAEPSLFLAKYHAYSQENGGHLIVLDRNYRSRDEVLQFTNFIFQQLMDPEFGQMAYDQLAALKTGNTSFLSPEDERHFQVEMLLNIKDTAESEETEEETVASDELDVLFDKAIDEEANLIAKDIYQRVQAGFQIYDKDQQCLRPLTYSDIVVLTATKDTFIAFKHACDRYEIPLYTQNIESYFQRQEIRLMVALLKIIDNPLQDIPLVAILRSFFVGLDDEALSRIRIHHPQGLFMEACVSFVNAYDTDALSSSEQAIGQQLSQFLTQLNQWQKQAQHMAIDELIWLIYQETHFLDYVAGLSNGNQRQANLHAFYQKAAIFEKSSFKGLFGFVTYIEQIMKYEHDLAEPILLEEEQNMVRIMTVHASKGLEFPVVYLMNMAKKFNMSDTKGTLITSKHHGSGIDYYDEKHLLRYPSFIKKCLAHEKELALKAEEMRKLYVALTRCEQKLILVGTIKDEASWQQTLERVTMAPSKECLIETALRRPVTNWLGWLNLVVARTGALNQAVTSYQAQDVCIKFVNDSQTLLDTAKANTQPLDSEKWLTALQQALATQTYELDPAYAYLPDSMQYQYPQLLASHTSSYQSVSELKRLYEEPAHDQLSHYQDRSAPKIKSPSDQRGIKGIRYTADTFQAPQFQQAQTMSYAQIGTLTHYVLQHLSFGDFAHQSFTQYPQILSAQLDTLSLTGQQKAVINQAHIVEFLQSDLGQLLVHQSAHLNREQAFSYLLPAIWLLKAQQSQLALHTLGSDQLLVHGVIDNYLVQADGLVLIDYKTDRYHREGSLNKTGQIEVIVDKYRFQVSLYAQALAQAKQVPVKAIYLVLLDFQEVVLVEPLEQLKADTSS